MRVTSGMIRNTSLNSLYNNMSELDTLFNQMNTLKKIQRPSDDPIVAGRSMKLRLDVMQTQQYKSNVNEASAWLDASENALSNMTEIVKDIRTRVVQASNGSLTDEEREKILADIEELNKQLHQEANATYGGRYIFSGFKTDQPIINEDGEINPEFIDEDGNFIIKDHEIEYEISPGVKLTINTTEVIDFMQEMDVIMNGDPNAEPPILGISEIIKNEDGQFTDEEISEMLSAKLDDLDDALSTLSQMTASVGSRQVRLQYTEERLMNDEVNLTELLSNTEDVDIEEVYVKFNTQYMVYQSALQATSQIVMNNLGDFLR